MNHLDTLELPAGKLRIYPGNARRADMDGLATSLHRNGQYRSIVVRADDITSPDEGGVILAGNHTYLAATEHMGWQRLRCELIECSDDEAKRIVLVDNKLNDRAKYDDDALGALLQEAAVDGLEGTGFTDKELARLLGDDLPAEGDAETEELHNTFGVTVEVDNEAQQAELLQWLADEGYRVRALMH